eukprot:2672900-Rhodomonas_salina.1
MAYEELQDTEMGYYMRTQGIACGVACQDLLLIGSLCAGTTTCLITPPFRSTETPLSVKDSFRAATVTTRLSSIEDQGCRKAHPPGH